MQTPFNDKLAYSYPCKPSETCIDYEDYDPCESNEDITEKDLAVLLKEEAAKLEREKEKTQTEKTEGEVDKKIKPASGNADGKLASGNADGKPASGNADGKLASGNADGKPKQLSQKNDADFRENEEVVEEQEENTAKRKTCKYIKNPFFTNRLKLSTSHLPLPPPGPPPQNFPLAKDDSDTKICPRKKKKCKKEEKPKKPAYKGTINTGEGALKDDSGEKDEDESGEKKGVDEVEDEDEYEYEDEDEDTGRDIDTGKDVVTDRDRDRNKGRDKDKDKDHKKKDTGKKQCKKRIAELLPPCKKKESEASINFGPRMIPLQQKDLPQTSPKDIPEVEHQILMACGKNQEEDCKKKCKKKDKVK